MKLLLKNSFVATSSTSTSDCAEQKTYIYTQFNGESSLGNLTENLKVDSIARSGWESILTVEIVNGKTLNILDHSAIIAEKEVEIARKKRSDE